MNLPTTVRVGPHVYTIQVWDHEDAQDEGGFGRTHKDRKIITVDTFYGDYQTLETFTHEIYHAIYCEFMIKSEDNEERTVTTLAKGWMCVMRDNPEVARMMGQLG